MPPEIDGLAWPTVTRAAHAWRQVERLRERAADREIPQRVGLEHRADSRGPRVDERRFRNDTNDFGYGPDLHGHGNVGDLSQADGDALLLKGLEALELCAKGVAAGCQERNAETTIAVGHRAPSALRPCCHNRDTRYGQLLRIEDAPGQGSTDFLCVGGADNSERKRHDKCTHACVH